LQNYPNPFNPQTTIEYGVSEPWTHVRIVVYDISGRVVKVLLDEERPAGKHAVLWDGRNDRGEAAASGVYVCDVCVGSLREQKKLVVLR
jgi:flagellar hook assembly protein FlgD